MILKSADRRSGRQDVILDAASRLFSTRGYHATSVQDIADAVGILKGSLYHHFESKEAILYHIVKEPIARLHRTVGEIAEAPGPRLGQARAGRRRARPGISRPLPAPLRLPPGDRGRAPPVPGLGRARTARSTSGCGAISSRAA